MENKRDSNIELLRIVSMILIIAYHCTINIGFFANNQVTSIILFSTGIWGVLGVDCFFIISFNFLYKSKFKTQKFLYIIKEILFYAIPLIIISVIYIYSKTGNNLLNIIKNILVSGIKQPFWRDIYWFSTIYLLMYLSFPMLNKILKKLKEKDLKQIVIILTGIIFLYQMKETVIEDYFFAIYMYITFFYIKNYKENWIKQNCLVCCLICTLLCIFLKIILECNNNSIFIINLISGKFGRHSILFFINSIFMFYMFKNIKLKQSKFINVIASTTFGIYLFHENQIFSIRNYIYNWAQKNIFKQISIVDSDYLLIFYIVEILAIFVTGIIIDLIRQFIFKILNSKKTNSKIESYYKKIDNKMNENYEENNCMIDEYTKNYKEIKETNYEKSIEK